MTSAWPSCSTRPTPAPTGSTCAITPGPSVSGTASFTGEGNNAVRYRALDAAGNVVAAASAAARRRSTRPPPPAPPRIRLRQHERPRRRRRAACIDTGANAETVKIATITTPAPASPNPNVTLYGAADEGARGGQRGDPGVPAVPRRSTSRSTRARRPRRGRPRCQQPRSATGSRRSRPPAPTRRPGSGGPAVRDTWLDGTWVYPLPLDPSQLSLGKHTWTLGLTDVAGNGNKVTFTFLVTTSFADIDALLARYGTAGTIPAADGHLAARLAGRGQGGQRRRRRRRRRLGLDAFVSQVRSTSPMQKARNLLVTDAQDVTRQVRGIPDAPAPADLGITSERYPGQPRHPYVTPAMPVAQREREVQGPRDRQQERRLVPPPGDRGRRGHDPGARRGQGLRRRPLGPVVAGRSRCRTRRSPAPPTSPSTP